MNNDFDNNREKNSAEEQNSATENGNNANPFSTEEEKNNAVNDGNFSALDPFAPENQQQNAENCANNNSAPFDPFGINDSAPQAVSPAAANASAEYLAKLNKQKKEAAAQRPLFVSCVGLILSTLFGLGSIISVIGLILAFSSSDKKSSSRQWAIAVGILGLVLSLLFIAATFFLCKGQMFNKTPEITGGYY